MCLISKTKSVNPQIFALIVEKQAKINDKNQRFGVFMMP